MFQGFANSANCAAGSLDYSTIGCEIASYGRPWVTTVSRRGRTAYWIYEVFIGLSSHIIILTSETIAQERHSRADAAGRTKRDSRALLCLQRSFNSSERRGTPEGRCYREYTIVRVRHRRTLRILAYLFSFKCKSVCAHVSIPAAAAAAALQPITLMFLIRC